MRGRAGTPLADEGRLHGERPHDARAEWLRETFEDRYEAFCRTWGLDPDAQGSVREYEAYWNRRH